MKYVVTSEEMKEYDNNTIEKIGIPALVLMERAALAVEAVIIKRFPKIKSALIVAGVGNNGADGLALARLLAERDCQVTVCIAGNIEKSSEQFKVQRDILKNYPVMFLSQESSLEILENDVRTQVAYDVVVDAIFGVGLSREITGVYKTLIDYMNQMRGYKIAVDIASGISADSGKMLGAAFKADVTVTFAFAKRGHYLYPGCEYSGELVIADIGISKRSFLDKVPEVFIYDENPMELLPARKGSGNKGTFGKVLIIAGFEQMVGAAVLCAKAAMEIGAGMVKVLCPKENQAILQGALTEVLYGTCENLESSLQWADVVAIGPGLGKSREAFEILQSILEKAKHPLVVDADALNLISENQELKNGLCEYKGCKILTPHIGELARLTGQGVAELKENLFEAAKSSSEEYKAVMVCKDARTVVVKDGCLYMNVSGNNGMATAGSGDVLTGIIAGLLAQGQDDMKAATVGVYLHGLAGDAAKDVYTEYGVTAGRLLEHMKELLSTFE